MIVRTIALSHLLVCALASHIFEGASTTTTTTTSLAAATTRKLDGGNQDGDWLQNYTIKYENCFHTDNVASFRLCPLEKACRKKCSNGGEYLVDLGYFIDAYTEAQLKIREYKCEMVRESCTSDDDYSCYISADMRYCGEANYDNNGFNVQKYLECKSIGYGYYVGPYCGSDNYAIHFGVFSDAYCTTHAALSQFKKLKGYDLPYSTESIITDDCLSCKETGLDDEGDEDDILEQCEGLYELTYTKCESNGMSNDVTYPSQRGCNAIETIKTKEGVDRHNFAWLYILVGSLLVLIVALLELLRQAQRKRKLEALGGEGDGVCYFLFQKRRKESKKNKTSSDDDDDIMKYYMEDDTDSDGSGNQPVA